MESTRTMPPSTCAVIAELRARAVLGLPVEVSGTTICLLPHRLPDMGKEKEVAKSNVTLKSRLLEVKPVMDSSICYSCMRYSLLRNV